MDSGNSGSLQSSSGGGDDEFDAVCGGGAADSSSPLSALLRHHPGLGGGGSPSLIYGLEELGAPPLSHWCPGTAPLPQPGAGAPASPRSLPCHGGPAASAPAQDHAGAATAAQLAAPARGSRKRARASRRAPTTVLTTDTSNFRAMVQEFTGIPAPPFASAARSRLDHLFPSRSSSAVPAALPQYLLRPLAHSKLHAYPPPASLPAPANAAIAASTVTHAGATAGDDSYQQHLTTAAPPALLGMQDHSSGGSNSYLSFQGALGAQLDGGGANTYPLFDDRGGVAPSSAPRPQDPAGFLGLARGSTVSTEGTPAHLPPRNSNELSGLVGGCKATYTSAPPPLERNGRIPPASGVPTATPTPTPVAAATAAVRTRGADSWVCGTSE
ncbi:verprolin-like [Panicum miliaceum]|uniref:Verprolin-like n=1 Tax=Panicum miliaceum TaxID=4540 RepID=A0A3L6RG71_PANMI|nr:verprolin-like [Panicum miliaceum]